MNTEIQQMWMTFWLGKALWKDLSFIFRIDSFESSFMKIRKKSDGSDLDNPDTQNDGEYKGHIY